MRWGDVVCKNIYICNGGFQGSEWARCSCDFVSSSLCRKLENVKNGMLDLIQREEVDASIGFLFRLS